MNLSHKQLACYERLQEPIERALSVNEYHQIETHLCRIYEMIGNMHNELKITAPRDATVRVFFYRPYKVMFAERFADAIRREITDQSIQQIRPLVGAVDQFTDCTDFGSLRRKTLSLFI